MLRYIYADSLSAHPVLARTMFVDRADQFKSRLKWDVEVNNLGEERDVYDTLNPLYVIWQLPDGTHGGSMRFLPTVERTMVNDCFRHLVGGGAIVSPRIWECTRFCLSRRACSRVAPALMLAGGELMENFGIEHFVGVFDKRMTHIYRKIGASPEVLGSETQSREQISVGLWHYSTEQKQKLHDVSGINAEESAKWLHTSLNEPAEETVTGLSTFTDVLSSLSSTPGSDESLHLHVSQLAALQMTSESHALNP